MVIAIGMYPNILRCYGRLLTHDGFVPANPIGAALGQLLPPFMATPRSSVCNSYCLPPITPEYGKCLPTRSDGIIAPRAGGCYLGHPRFSLAHPRKPANPAEYVHIKDTCLT